MALDYSKVDWTGLAKKVSGLRATGLRKNMHTYNAYNFQSLARELDDAMGSTGIGYFERLAESYAIAAGRDYDIYTGRKLNEFAFFAKQDMARGLQDWHKDYLQGLLS